MNPTDGTSEKTNLSRPSPSNPDISKTVEVSFSEQAKAVVASVSVRAVTLNPTPEFNKEILREAEELLASAYATSKRYTFDKNR